MLLVPRHQLLCVFDGQHPMLSGGDHIVPGRAWTGGMGWDGMGWMDGVVLLLFVVVLDSSRRYIVHGRHGGTWTGTYRNGVPKYMPIGTYRFVVLCTGYGTYPPLLLLSLNLKTSLWPGPDLGSSPPPWPLPRGGPHRTKSHPTPGALVSQSRSPPSTSQLHSPPLSIVLLMTQAQIPWEGVPVLRCFSGKIHLPSTFSHHSPSRGTSAPTQPNQGRASITFTSRLPLPTVYYCPPSSSSHYLQLQLHNDDHLSGAIPYDRSVQGAIFTQVFHFTWKHPPQSPRTLSPSVPAQPRSLHSVIAHRP